MYEHRTAPLLHRTAFYARVAGHAAVALALIGGSLGAGMVGYHLLGDLPWLDAFLNAAMILGGMGPVDPMTVPAAKLFAGLYALYSGLVLVAAAGLIVAPFLHRVLHRFHLAEDGEE